MKPLQLYVAIFWIAEGVDCMNKNLIAGMLFFVAGFFVAVLYESNKK